MSDHTASDQSLRNAAANLQAASKPTPEAPPPPPRLGELLKEARQERDLDLSTVAAKTHVRKEYLRALEEGRYEDLPEDVYTRNFLRLYARTLELPSEKLLALYSSERQAALAPEVEALEPSRSAPKVATAASGSSAPRRLRVPYLGVVIPTVVLVVAVVGLAVWGYTSNFFTGSSPAVTAGAATDTAADRVATATTDGAAGAAVGGTDAGATAAGATAAGATPVETPTAEASGAEGIAINPDTVRLSIATEPPGAEVSIDAFPLPGTTPLQGIDVTARPRRVIRVSLDGYQPIEQEVDFTRDQSLTFTLVPDLPAVGGAAETPSAVAAEGRIVLDITEPTWLEVYQGTARNQGERLVYATANPGERYEFELPVYLHVGNGAGVVVSVSGQEIGPMGSRGAVVGRAFTE